MRPAVFPTVPLKDFALLDSGAGEKLERCGPYVLRRPDPQAVWSRSLSDETWQRADLVFVRESDRGGRWEGPQARRGVPEWTIDALGATVRIRPTPFKHIGIFPEQAPNWKLVEELRPRLGAKPRLLNLFGYSGLATVLAARHGYETTHVDASKAAIAWTRENQALSGLPDSAVRVVLEDALAYARREARRGSRYEVVLLDPPHYGRGPKGETWQFEDQVAELVHAVRDVLAERSLVVLSTYAIGCTPLTFANLFAELGPGRIEAAELALTQEDGARQLPCGFCARHMRGLEASAVSPG
jgi:23S rRNA (cytosine1962-C5)-methyltransferase